MNSRREWWKAMLVALMAALPLPCRGDSSTTNQAPPEMAAVQPNSPPPGPGFDSNLTGNWGGVRQHMQDAGYTIGATLLLEGFANTQGGVDTAHQVGSTTFDVNLSADFEKLFQVHGGQFYIDLEDHAFRNPSSALVGDLQIFDKQNSTPYLQIFELWYQQKLFDGKLRIKIGKIDANTEFSVIDYGLPFISSSTQVTPTFFVFPTTPDPMPGINVFFTPAEWYYASFGTFYSNRSDRFGDLVDNPARYQLSDYGALFIGEAGLKWHANPVLPYAGNLKAGIWGHNGAFTKFDGTTQQGTWGYYLVFNQTLWQPQGAQEPGPGLRSFLEYAQTQTGISPINRHMGGGLSWTGITDLRPNDIIGFSPQYAHISPDAGLPHPYELDVEAFYQLQVAPWAFVQPDFQYFVHPGGIHPNAFVITLRMLVTF
jgi:porin